MGFNSAFKGLKTIFGCLVYVACKSKTICVNYKFEEFLEKAIVIYFTIDNLESEKLKRATNTEVAYPVSGTAFEVVYEVEEQTNDRHIPSLLSTIRIFVWFQLTVKKKEIMTFLRSFH